MALSKKQIANFWSEWDESMYGPKAEWFPPPDKATRIACEQHLRVRLPDDLIALLKYQNGGEAIVGFSPFMPLLPPTSKEEYRIQTLIAAAGQNIPCRFEDLAWIAEEFGSPDLIVPLESDGHCFHALNYNTSGPQGEPSVVYIDIEGGGGELVADSVAAWVEECIANQPDE